MADNLVIQAIFKLVDQLTGPLRNITKGLGDVDKAAEKTAESLEDVGKAATEAASGGGGGGGGKGVSGLLDTFIRFSPVLIGVATALGTVAAVSVDAQRSLNDLRIAVNIAGEKAGLTAERLVELSTQIERTSRFSSGSAQSALALGLQFGVTADSVERFAKLLPDVAQVLGTDLPAAAEFLGRVMQAPERSFRQLRAAGIELSEEQQELIKWLVDTGDAATATSIVMGKLEDKTKGAAEQGLNTLGGAFERLFNQLKSSAVFVGPVDSITNAINRLTESITKLQDATARFEARNEGFFDNLPNAITSVLPPGIREGVQAFRRLGASPETAAEGGPLAGAVPTESEKAEAQAQFRKRLAEVFGENSKELNKQLDKFNKETAALAKQQERDEASFAAKLPLLTGVTPRSARTTTLASVTAETQSSEERKADAYLKKLGDLEYAYENLGLSVERFNELQGAALDATGLEEYKVKSKRVAEGIDELTAAQRRAAENIQDAFGAAFASIDKGVKGMVAAFLQAFKTILAQKAALKFSEFINDSFSGASKSSGGGFGATLLRGAAKLFGFAGGGSVSSGRPILVGETGPELFVPSVAGRIASNPSVAGMGGGRFAYSPSTNIVVNGNALDDKTKAELIGYVEASRVRDQRELQRMLERNGFGRLR